MNMTSTTYFEYEYDCFQLFEMQIRLFYIIHIHEWYSYFGPKWEFWRQMIILIPPWGTPAWQWHCGETMVFVASGIMYVSSVSIFFQKVLKIWTIVLDLNVKRSPSWNSLPSISPKSNNLELLWFRFWRSTWPWCNTHTKSDNELYITWFRAFGVKLNHTHDSIIQSLQSCFDIIVNCAATVVVRSSGIAYRLTNWK